MTEQRFRVGIVGLEPGRGWAARAHIPALRALSDRYEIVGVANTSLASAQRAAAALGLPRAFDDVAEPVSAPELASDHERLRWRGSIDDHRRARRRLGRLHSPEEE